MILYSGKTNDYTFRKNIDHNALGAIKSEALIMGQKYYLIEFSNGLIVTIDEKDVEFVKDK